jgi:hypothetical protein
MLISPCSGRNVCIDFLIDHCKLGPRKCLYSHDKTYLPSGGWWNDREKIEQRSTLKLVQVYFKPKNHEDQGEREKDIFLARLKASVERAAQQAPEEAPSTSQPLAPKPLVKPVVLLLSLENEDFFATIHADVFAALRDKSQVIQALTHQDALKHLSSPALAGVFVTDPGIVRGKASAVVNRLVAYVKSGGSAVIGGSFSSFIRPTDFDQFFKKVWGLDWQRGSYFRTTFSINPSNELAKRNPSLATSYSMKALHVNHISPEMALYGDFTSMPLEESPAVCVRVGHGLLSYLGDVNAETASTNTVLAMLGLLDASNELLSPSRPSTSLPGIEITPTEFDVQWTEANFILIIALKHTDAFMQVWKSHILALREKRQVHVADTMASALDYLASHELDGVYVADEGVLDRQILSKLVEYTMSGGTVVVGGVLPSMAKESQIATFFSAFHLSWRREALFSQFSDLNLDHNVAKLHPSLSESYCHNAVTLKGVDRDAILYTPFTPGLDQLEAPIAQTRVLWDTSVIPSQHLNRRLSFSRCLIY